MDLDHSRTLFKHFLPTTVKILKISKCYIKLSLEMPEKIIKQVPACAPHIFRHQFSYFFHMCVGLERWCIPRGLIPLRPSCTKIHQHSSSASSLSSSSSSDEVRNSFRCIASISNYFSFLTLRSFQRGVFVVK